MLTKAYRVVVDHLTKALGVLGAAMMSVLAYLDPLYIREAAHTFLGDHEVEKMGAGLFILVIIRGYFTGRKARDAARQLAEAQALAQVAAAAAAIPQAQAKVPAPVSPAPAP
ncbi:MAG TPA: hypothetical protein VLH80_07535 [Nitrospiraceae bacterium]|nr:hypothetical protein [Nitrospiraceae bacterium]